MIKDAGEIIKAALKAADPYKNVSDALRKKEYSDNITVISAGKAACVMAQAAYDTFGNKIKDGYVITKHGHSVPLPEVFTVGEAGHPLPDENSVKHTEKIIEKASRLGKDDKILFLLSGGASAIFESPEVPLSELQKITETLLKCGADINEINTVRKRLSKVKGGKFAKMCECEIDCVILSDVLGDRLDVIASGPCCADTSSVADVFSIIKKYDLNFSAETEKILSEETPENVANVNSVVAGNIEMLCNGAAEKAKELGYDVHTVTTSMTGEAREKGKEIAREAIRFSEKPHKPTVFIYGGETTVTVKGNGKGGRNQEMALAAAIELREHKNITVLSLGSDGTDGPTDAAGGIVSGETYGKMAAKGIDPEKYLNNNDSYNALDPVGSLLKTGPTGTNVNDITLAIIT